MRRSKQTKERSGWSAKRTLAALGISRGSYYRWLKEEAWAKEQAGRSAGASLRGLAGGASGGAGVRPAASGDSSSGAGLADDRRGRGVSEPFDGVSDSAGSEPDVPAARAEEALPGGDRESDASRRAVGDGPDVRDGERRGLLLPGVHRRVFAVHRALGAALEHGRSQRERGRAESLGDVAARRSGASSWPSRRFAATTGVATSRRSFMECWSIMG